MIIVSLYLPFAYICLNLALAIFIAQPATDMNVAEFPHFFALPIFIQEYLGVI